MVIFVQRIETMSEDKTEIVGNTEPTEELENQKVPTTQIMLEAILARMNQGFAEIHTELRRMNKRLDVMTIEMQRQDVEQRLTIDRVESLERKAS